MDWRRRCHKLYWRAQGLIAPSLVYSQSLYEETLARQVETAGSWLDVGCGHQLLRPWATRRPRLPRLLVGVDIDHDSLRRHPTIVNLVQADISDLPFPDATFELVTANMVLEHLRDPRRQLAEIRRILKPGGRLLVHTPNAMSYATLLARAVPERAKGRLVWFLQRRRQQDVVPTYYRANSSRALAGLAARAGLEVDDLRLIASTPQLIVVPPLMILELLLIRALLTRAGRRFRPNIVAVLRRPEERRPRRQGARAPEAAVGAGVGAKAASAARA